jgi:transcriptional regulator
MARANPQWQELAGQGALVVFSGPHAYISPTWYGAENVVPTWNYVAVHAYGTVELCEDPATVRQIIEHMVAEYEAALPRPWTFDGRTTFAERLLTQIVAFRLPIQRLEGKWKLNQNHPAERREMVAEALEARGSEDERAIAELMRQKLKREGNQAS